jgi:dihydropteroate synthase
MGILNVTPDSFSDGSRYLDLELAVDRALEMESEGASIIDIGGESTRPNAEPVGLDEELRRVIPVIERLAGRLSVPVSIDTHKAAVAREAVAAGAEIVNDISAFTFDPAMASVVADSGAGAVLMHTRGGPREMQKDTEYRDIVSEVIAFLDGALAGAERAGIGRNRLVVDPGIGFGKSVSGNLEIIRRLGEFARLGSPILIGTSRKSFIGALLDRDVDGRLMGTAATVAAAVLNGASVIRVHDVAAMRDVAAVSLAIRNGIQGSQ